MKAKVYTFLLVAFLVTGALPLYNLSQRVAEGNFKNLGWKKLGTLYSVDWIMPFLGRTAYSYGISIAPQNVIIGKDNWLFAGDSRSSGTPLTNKRLGIRPDRVATLAKFVVWVTSWDQWFKRNGVQEFRFMIGPDKDSIYPEYLPDWVDPAKVQLTDLLAKTMPANLYVDLHPALMAAKAEYAKAEPLLTVYYPTDTHWNFVGAWAAMTALQKSLGATQPQLTWLDPQLGRVAEVKPQPRNDIGKFMYMGDKLPDLEVLLKFHTEPARPTEYYNYISGQRLSPDDPNTFNAPHIPTLAKTETALNRKRVLWLHDSFGLGMAPFMKATFSEILDIHPMYVDSAQLAELVRKFKPDYVFVTNVERYILADQYSDLPPQ